MLDILRRIVLWGGLALLCLLPMLAEALGEGFYITMMNRVLILALAAMSLNLILGYGGMVSFGHAAYLGIGAYTVGILAYHSDAWFGTESAFIALPAAMLVAAILALAIGAISLRTSGVYFIMITLAFAQMVYFFFVSQQEYGGMDGMQMWSRSDAGPIDLSDNASFYYVVLGLLLVLLYAKYRLVRSRFGLVLRGIRENERRMKALGFPTYRYKLVAFVISGAVAGLAGAMMANLSEFVSPSLLHWTRSGEMMVMVILGGMGTIAGPILGALAFLVLEDVLSEITQHWMIVLGPLLILIVLVARRGLYGLLDPKGGPK
ncbi:MAG: branched-chain amino acid ABC transporter permease [Alphaproteobacteria bacterium]|nr:branched-chain amino acid ABC transporter permease [Alphaproteobacteria bacterium]